MARKGSLRDEPFRLTMESPEPADVADALAIALCHGYLDVRRRGNGPLSAARARPPQPFRPGNS